MANIVSLISLSLGGILGVIFILKLFKPTNLRFLTLMLGAAAFFIAIFIQTPVQQFPLLFEGIKTVEDIIYRGIFVTLGAVFYMGFIAGIIQEVVKYVFLKRDNVNIGLHVGLGFGVAELVYLLIYAVVITVVFGSSSNNISSIWYLFPGIERFLVIIFHTVTAIYMALYGKNGLLVAIISHGAIDSLAACIQFYANIYGYDTFLLAITGILYLLILVLDVSFIKSLENVRKTVTESA